MAKSTYRKPYSNQNILGDKTNVYNPKVRGRGALDNPTGRYENYERILVQESDFSDPEEQELALQGRQIDTQVFRDSSRSIISTNDSPDTMTDLSVNPYRGCEHGCIYCFARPYHEYFGLSLGLDFETKIFAKPDAPQLLKEKLQSSLWQKEPKVITMSGATDPYQPIEKKMRITRGCLEVLTAFRNPVAIITKNYLVTRDIDLYSELAKYNAVIINSSITTLDSELARNMEPRASQPRMRLKAIEEFAKAGVHVNVMIGPVLPGLNDNEIPKILEQAANAGAKSAGYTILRLPYGVKDIFQKWLYERYPLRAEKILNRIKEVHGGKLYDSTFGKRKTGEGIYAEQIDKIFQHSKKRFCLTERIKLSTAHFKPDAMDEQMKLF